MSIKCIRMLYSTVVKAKVHVICFVTYHVTSHVIPAAFYQVLIPPEPLSRQRTTDAFQPHGMRYSVFITNSIVDLFRTEQL